MPYILNWDNKSDLTPEELCILLRAAGIEFTFEESVWKQLPESLQTKFLLVIPSQVNNGARAWDLG